MLSDLTFIEDGNPSTVDGGLINWSKRALLHSILSEFHNFQLSCKYTFPFNYSLRNSIFSSINNQYFTSKELHELSLEVEPRNFEPPTVTPQDVLKRMVTIKRRPSK